MVDKIQYNASFNVARNNMIRADLFSLEQAVNSTLKVKREVRGGVALYVAKWNVRPLMNRKTLQHPERQTRLVAMEMKVYDIELAALSELRLPGYGSEVHLGYVFFCSGKLGDKQRDSGVGFVLKK